MVIPLDGLKIRTAYLNSMTPKIPVIYAKNFWIYCIFSQIYAILAFLAKFGCHGNRPCSHENSDSKFEFADPKMLLFTRKISWYVVQDWNQSNFWLYLAKFGCYGNRPCFPKTHIAHFNSPTPRRCYSHEIFSICCTGLKSVQFWLIFAQSWLPWQPPLLLWKFR